MWAPGHEILTVEEMAEVDRLTELSGIPTSLLMENAGRQVANEISKRWTSRKTTVLCGPGNNGGDGFVVARHLAARGWPVEIITFGKLANASAEAAKMARRWQGPTRHFQPAEPIHGELVVDAIFGAGLSRGLSADLVQMFEDIEMADVPIIAVDVPSGVHGDQARFLDGVQPWSAKLCVTFFRKKPAHVLYPARQHCGEVVCANIGIPDGMLHALAKSPLGVGGNRSRCDENHAPADVEALKPAVHKFQRGHCLVISGPASMTGAARLAGRAALRSGAGLVTIAGDQAAVSVLSSQLTAIMVQDLSVSRGIETILKDVRLSAVVIGPGCAADTATQGNVRAVLAAGIPTVLDAGALSAFAPDPAVLFRILHEKAVLTPHEGEFERLFPGLLAKSANRIEAARSAASSSGAVVLLKGPDTVVAAPDGTAVVNTNAPVDLATAGSGDVLAGLITGLMAQGIAPFEAAKRGTFYHAVCGRLAGAGLIAEDLPDLLPAAMNG